MSKQQKNVPLKSQKNMIQTSQKLQSSISQLTNFVKSLLSTFTKEGRRILALSNIQSSNKTFQGYVQNPTRYKFNQFTEYSQLISKQTHKRIYDQVLLKLNILKNNHDKQKQQQRRKQHQNLLKNRKSESQPQQTIKKDNSNMKQQVYSFEMLVEQYQKIKQNFYRIWKQQYVLSLNYRLVICAKQLERWTEISSNKVDKNKIQKDIEKMFN